MPHPLLESLSDSFRLVFRDTESRTINLLKPCHLKASPTSVDALRFLPNLVTSSSSAACVLSVRVQVTRSPPGSAICELSVRVLVPLFICTNALLCASCQLGFSFVPLSHWCEAPLLFEAIGHFRELVLVAFLQGPFNPSALVWVASLCVLPITVPWF
jgi:hypothetical protein